MLTEYGQSMDNIPYVGAIVRELNYSYSLAKWLVRSSEHPWERKSDILHAYVCINLLYDNIAKKHKKYIIRKRYGHNFTTCIYICPKLKFLQQYASKYIFFQLSINRFRLIKFSHSRNSYLDLDFWNKNIYFNLF